jgi:hypothetical protein
MQDHNLQQIDDRYAYLTANDELVARGAAPIDDEWFDKEQNDDRQAAQANIGQAFPEGRH